jgi:hypothetical protein
VELMGPAAPVVLVVPRLAGRAVPVELVLAGPGDRVELMGLAAPVVLVLPRLAGRAVPVELDLARLVAPAVPAPPVAMAPVDLADLARRAAPVDLASRVVLLAMGPVDLAARVDLVQTGRAAPADRVEDRVELTSRVDPVDLEAPADPVDPVDLEAPDLTGRADRHRRRTSNMVSTTGVAPRWAAPGTCRTDSARRIMGRRLRPGSTDSAGTAGLPPVLRRRSGTDHHLQVAGAGPRLPVAGTAHGTGRPAMSQSRSVISGRLVTTGTTRSRCSTRYSVDGASGSSVSGSRCTDLTISTPD